MKYLPHTWSKTFDQMHTCERCGLIRVALEPKVRNRGKCYYVWTYFKHEGDVRKSFSLARQTPCINAAEPAN